MQRGRHTRYQKKVSSLFYRRSLTLANTYCTSGVTVSHTKDGVVADVYVMVIARPIMRKLLARKVQEEQLKLKQKGGANLSKKRMNAIGHTSQLTEKLCPFTEAGEAYDSGKLYALYKYVGMRALIIPFFFDYYVVHGSLYFFVAMTRNRYIRRVLGQNRVPDSLFHRKS